jgi:hypothetical protein
MHRNPVRVACKIEQRCCLSPRFHPSNAASDSSKVSPMLLSLHVSPEAGLACSSIAASKRPASQGGGWSFWPGHVVISIYLVLPAHIYYGGAKQGLYMQRPRRMLTSLHASPRPTGGLRSVDFVPLAIGQPTCTKYSKPSDMLSRRSDYMKVRPAQQLVATSSSSPPVRIVRVQVLVTALTKARGLPSTRLAN